MTAPTRTDTFSTADGLRLYTAAWLPDDTPKAIVLLVHGIGEHSGRYAHVAAHLLAHSYAVYTLDHRGHGRSEGRRGYFADINHPVDDLKGYFDTIRHQHPDMPVFLYGHSLGSVFSMLFALRYQQELAGLIVTGSPLRLEEVRSPLLVLFGTLTHKFIPTWRLAPAVDVTILTRDEACIAATRADPLVYKGMNRIGPGYQLVLGCRIIRANLRRFRLPLLIMHGGGDRLCPPAGSELIYAEAGSADKTLRIYPGLYHEIHNEPEKATVLTDITDWLAQR